ncbi:TIR domain-containing protein [Aquimarina mytili]|uniref:Toll/interleukin-1 receptor domain-containing protein n=1 Tax=Aquimarina mytili TaxID=874423 RepID=A0A936ZWS9_9FLAO|nr:TIR domain-containing protein [Aquimarina mytili]MBL0682471.1 toll/interleukin-1 receptor domain-containing protein [Aquimarina mytili]
MSILPQYGLLQLRNSARIYTKDVTESLQLFKKETKNLKVTLFISHHPDELEELDSAINFLKGFGVLLHADWLDKSIPKDKSDATTKQLQQQIRENSKFIFLATETAVQDKWCDWVLRLAATIKKPEDIAVLPIREDFSDYGGAEYLKKHAYIKENDFTAQAYDVKYPNGKEIALSKWFES